MLIEKLVITNQTKIRRRICVTPQDLRSIASQLEEAAKFANKNEVVDLDIVVGNSILTFEFSPERERVGINFISCGSTPDA